MEFTVLKLAQHWPEETKSMNLVLCENKGKLEHNQIIIITTSTSFQINLIYYY